MERAKELLEQPDIKIMDIAERLGYADNHYFSKAFRIYYHVTPTQYRNQPQKQKVRLHYIPYYTWANRGENEMQVWTRVQNP